MLLPSHGVVMCSYNAVTMGNDHAASISGGTPSCANEHYLRGVLREKWGWKDGVVVSDCQAIAIIKVGHGSLPFIDHTRA